MSRYFFYGAIFLVGCSAATLQARIIHVPSDSSTIQGGIDGAIDGDTVVVATGIYHEHGIDFLGKAIVVTGTDPEDSITVSSTIVDGESLGGIFTFQSGEDSSSVLSGLTITGGRDNGGGGIRCTFSSPRIEFCIIRDNRSGGGGGLSFSTSSATVSNCLVTDNFSIDYGGGIQCFSAAPTFSSCTIRLNRAIFAGGGVDCFSSSPVFLNCTLSENSLTEPFTNYGGGLSLSGGSNPTLLNSNISDNAAMGTNGLGGGIYSNSSSSATLRNCIVSRNGSGANGGGLYFEGSSPVVSFCTITENSANLGGGIYLLGSPDLRVTNSIVWNNDGDEILIGGGTAEVTFTNVEGGWSGEGNIDADPRFITFSVYPYLLRPSSPCIDAGDPVLVDGFTWPLWYPNGTRADMGAYGGPDNAGWLP